MEALTSMLETNRPYEYELTNSSNVSGQACNITAIPCIRIYIQNIHSCTVSRIIYSYKIVTNVKE